MISVIIPLYNKEDFIKEAVSSVLAQSFTNFELIIINDGSTDGSLSIVNTLDDERVKIISTENQGVGAARNLGIQNSINDWVAFLDADDYWQSSFLEELVKAMNDYPSNKIFVTGRSRIYKDTIERYQNKYLPVDGTTKAINYYKIISKYLPPINSSNTIINKTYILENKGFNKNIKQYEDHDLWIRLCVNQPVVMVNKPLSFYRKTEEQTASNRLFGADDFCVYISTLLSVRQKLSDKDKKYFNRYVNRFVFFTFLKYNWHYNSRDRRKVYLVARYLLNTRGKAAIWFLNGLPINLYGLLKKFRDS